MPNSDLTQDLKELSDLLKKVTKIHQNQSITNLLEDIQNKKYANVKAMLAKVIATLSNEIVNAHRQLFQVEKELGELNEKHSNEELINLSAPLTSICTKYSRLQQNRATQKILLTQYDTIIKKAKRFRLNLYKKEKKYSGGNIDSLLITLDDIASLIPRKKDKNYIEKIKDVLIMRYAEKNKLNKRFAMFEQEIKPNKLFKVQKKIFKEVTYYVQAAPKDYRNFCNKKIMELDKATKALKQHADENLNQQSKKYQICQKLCSELFLLKIEAQSKINRNEDNRSAFNAVVDCQEACAKVMMQLNAAEVFAEHEHNRVLMNIGKALFFAVSALIVTAPYWLDRLIFKIKTGHWEPISLKDKPTIFYKFKDIQKQITPLAHSSSITK